MSIHFLKGVKGLELATFVAAPAATRILADWGAEVIKIETEHGDPIRYVGPDKKMPLDLVLLMRIFSNLRTAVFS